MPWIAAGLLAAATIGAQSLPQRIHSEIVGSERTELSGSLHPVALAGIMGGAESEISATTTDLLLESAHFDPLTVRRAARRLETV